MSNVLVLEIIWKQIIIQFVFKNFNVIILVFSVMVENIQIVQNVEEIDRLSKICVNVLNNMMNNLKKIVNLIKIDKQVKKLL